MAAAVPQGSRSRGAHHGGARDRVALGRRADRAHQLCQVGDAALQGAQLLAREGYKPGDRIATLAWNTAVTSRPGTAIMGMGGVYHTLNPRLFPEQIAWIMNHAEDRRSLST
jgi:acyl-CoA synthetase (AMP-forming)/AMP-acid ligase II